MLHLLSDFLPSLDYISDSPPTYWYEGNCPQTGRLLKLPRTALAEAVARELMQNLAKDDRHALEGKMYGVLLVELPSGEKRVLQAFSGLLNGQAVVDGWVPPLPGREQVALAEIATLRQLEAMKQDLICLEQRPERQQYQTLSTEFENRLRQLADRHRSRKHDRDRLRQRLSQSLTGEALAAELEKLDEQSRQDGIERRNLKRQRDVVLKPLQAAITAADDQMRDLKQQRKALSKTLQNQMHAAYWLMNFAGEARSLQQVMPQGIMPTGTGDCCAPKLLHYAATHRLQPMAMAEFWWGATHPDKVEGEFYGACADRCQPLMGFLLSGIPQAPLRFSPCHRQTVNLALPILYEDEWLVVVNKPAGLLSVPGRYLHAQDSVLSRLRHLLPNGKPLIAVHRLDRGTSGILLLAKDLDTYHHLSQQFQQRQVQKRYEAILAGAPTVTTGTIDLPLWADPDQRPYQKVDWQRGKPSVTKFQAIDTVGNHTRIEFMPLTGRTHQLRVHAAHPQGLGVPILGDRLYGCQAEASRLHLHAQRLQFAHPQTKEMICLQAEPPF
ncbi:MAG: RluA family pseudouridine synthase [Elainellaceae cyanobacterium]